MADGFVQVALDSTGKKVDTTERTRPDNTVVEVQRVDVPGTVSVEGQYLAMILEELRSIRIGISLIVDENLNPTKL